MLLSYCCRHLHHHQYHYHHHGYIFQGDRCVGSAISLLWMVVHSVQVGGHIIGHLTVNLHNPDFYFISSRNIVVAPTTPVQSCPNYTLLCNLVYEINIFFQGIGLKDLKQILRKEQVNLLSAYFPSKHILFIQLCFSKTTLLR